MDLENTEKIKRYFENVHFFRAFKSDRERFLQCNFLNPGSIFFPTSHYFQRSDIFAIDVSKNSFHNVDK